MADGKVGDVGGKKSITRTVVREQMFWKGRVMVWPPGVTWVCVRSVERMEEMVRGEFGGESSGLMKRNWFSELKGCLKPLGTHTYCSCSARYGRF